MKKLLKNLSCLKQMWKIIIGICFCFDNPNNGLFETGSRVIMAIPDEGFYFFKFLTINIESDVTIFPKFLNKLNLIKRFSEIVIGDGENGPMHTLKWKAMKIYIQGASSEILDGTIFYPMTINLTVKK